MRHLNRQVQFSVSILLLLAPLLLTACNAIEMFLGRSAANRTERIPQQQPPVVADPDMIVIGQKDFSYAGENGGTPGPRTFYYPQDVYYGAGKIFVSDGDSRVLIYNANNLTEDPVVIGQSNAFSASDGSVSANTLNWPAQIATDGTKLIVADVYNSRVLIYNNIPASSGTAADVVVGQVDFSSNSCDSPTSANLCYPSGVGIVGGKLVIADTYHHRLLIYNSIPTTNGANADAVIGQADFVSWDANRGGAASATTLSSPNYIATDGTALAVSEWDNNRVLIFNTVPSGPATAADVVIGQPDFSTTSAGTSPTKLSIPSGLRFVGTKFFVADSGNNRILYFATAPTVNGTAASTAIGQGTLTVGSANRGSTVSANGFNYPAAIAFDGSRFVVADYNNHRLQLFNSLPTSDQPADSAFGQANLTESWPRGAGMNNNGFYQLTGAAVSDTHLVVFDQGLGRALIFNKSTPREGAIAVLGRTSFTDFCMSSCSSRTASFYYPLAGAFDSQNRFYVNDNGGNRILVYNTLPTTSGAAADFVLGQDDFTTTTANSGGIVAGQLNSPQGVFAFGDRLYVADTYNQRVLVFQLPITQNRQLPILSIGSASVNSLGGGAISATNLSFPAGIFTDGSRLFITEWIGNRILVYNTIPTTSGIAADYAIGAPNMTTTGQSTTQTAGNFGTYNTSTWVLDNFLFAADKNFGRVMGFDLSLLATGMNATKVFGQDSLLSSLYAPNGSENGVKLGYLSSPVSIIADSKYVWITDRWTYRVIRIKKEKFWSYVK